MIAKAKACKGGSNLANYVMKPEKGYELMRFGLCEEKPTELLNEFKMIQYLNSRAKNKTFSLVLSPEKNEGNLLSDAKLRKLTKEFMKELDIDPEQQQFIAVVHTEKEHKHIHIIANRVKPDGTVISDKHIGKRAQWIAHRLAKKYNLISAKEKQIQNLQKLKNQEKNLKGIKKGIKRKHDWAIKQNPTSVKAYIKIMRKMGVEVTPSINQFSNKVQGLRVKDKESDLDFKASEVHRSMSLNKIMANGIPFDEESYAWEIYSDAKMDSKEFEFSRNQFLSELSWAIGGQQENIESEYDKKKKRRKKNQNRRSGGRKM